MSEPLRVRIVKCSLSACWYSNSIFNEFSVEAGSLTKFYRVCGTDDYILKSDCAVLGEDDGAPEKDNHNDYDGLQARHDEFCKDWDTQLNAMQDRDNEIAALRAQVEALRSENTIFRNAQKACEDCEGPTKAEFAALREGILAHQRMRDEGYEVTQADLDAVRAAG